MFPSLDADPAEVRALLAPLRNDFSVALYAAGNAFAVGAVIRVAHNFLAREVILVGGEAYYAKASMGMEKYESVVRVEDQDNLVRHAGGRPIWAFEREAATVGLPEVGAFPPGVILLFGSERHGLPPSMLQRSQAVVAIPQYGVNQSLPLAVAAGIAMHEWARRHYAGGRVVGDTSPPSGS